MTVPTMVEARADPDGTRALFVELAALDEGDPRWGDVRNALVTRYMSVADNVARRFANRGQPTEDLAQVAAVGLIHAVDRFDPDRGTDFLSFAVPTVMGEVRRYFRDSTWSMNVPRRLKELHLSIGTATSELYQRNGRAPRPSELAAYLGVPLDEVYEGLVAAGAYRPLSVDAPTREADGSATIVDRLGDEDPELARVEDQVALGPLVQRLPDRDRRIISMRFGAGLTQSQIAARIGISQMHVSRLLAQILERLRAGLTEAAPTP